MSMTENEAIDVILKDHSSFTNPMSKAYVMACKALEEIQQYKAMEERLNGISVKQVVNGFINQVEKETHEGYEKGRILTNAEADDWDAYRAIGTVEEFKALKEKSVAKMMDGYYCPICRHYFEDTDAYNYYPVCGQKMKSILE